MDKWPEGWSREGRERPPQPRTSVLPPAHADPPYAPYGDPYGDPYADRPYDDRGVPPRTRTRVGRRRPWGRRLLIVALVLLVAIVAGYFYLDSRLNRVDVLGDYAGRPDDTPGTNWLIVGS